MKVDGNAPNHNSKDIKEIFGITRERWNEISKFMAETVVESIVNKSKRSEIMVKVVEFSNTPIEALVIYSYMDEKRREINMIQKGIQELFTGKNKGSQKIGEIVVQDGKIIAVNGDDIPDEMIDDFTNIAEQLKQFKPTGNMNVDGDGKLN